MLTLPDLPYKYSALLPYISEDTLRLHHDKHHRAYVNAANTLLRGTGLQARTLEEIIAAASRDTKNRALFNNAAQAWNHTFYWSSMRPEGGGEPTGIIAEHIAADFGSYDAFHRELAAAATGQFGSGWAWLVLDQGVLKVTQTANAETPITDQQIPILTIDVWEHAYYVDYRNRRPDYVATFLSRLVNWDFANRNLERALQTSRAGEQSRAARVSA
jgi:Fe-Mn family superoxide dismutase